MTQNILVFAEGSDQNFANEEAEGEKESLMCKAKRLKSCSSDASINDQVICKLNYFVGILASCSR